MQVRLSWDCSKSAPPPYPGARPLLEGRPSVGPPSPRASTFRPRGFSPPRRFAPRTDRGSIAPRTGHGVRHVSRFAAPDVQARLDLAPVPRDAVHTPRRIPLAGSRTASPRPLPPCRSARERPPGRPLRARSAERCEQPPSGCPWRHARPVARKRRSDEAPAGPSASPQLLATGSEDPPARTIDGCDPTPPKRTLAAHDIPTTEVTRTTRSRLARTSSRIRRDAATSEAREVAPPPERECAFQAEPT
jgi:hypothetical protein